MPIYEWQCEQGHRQEHWVARFEDAPSLVACPCGLEAARIISVPSFRMAGETNWGGATMEDVWGDNPIGQLEDGVNPLRYKSKKIQVDLSRA